MKHRTALTWIVTAVVMVGAAACGGNEPPPQTEPQGPSEEELAQMREDSIRRAEAQREAERRAEEEARRAEEERQRRIAEARDVLTQRVFFEFDRSRITPQAEQLLEEKAEILRQSPQVRLRLEGHADERGSNEYNMALGSRRAESVLDFFDSYGLSANRFETVSYGEERPLVDESNEEAWAQNRRVEFVIIAGENQISPVSD